MKKRWETAKNDEGEYYALFIDDEEILILANCCKEDGSIDEKRFVWCGDFIETEEWDDYFDSLEEAKEAAEEYAINFLEEKYWKLQDYLEALKEGK